MDNSNSNSTPRTCKLTLLRIELKDLERRKVDKICVNDYELDTLSIIANADISVAMSIKNSKIKQIRITGDRRLKLNSLEINDSRIDDGLKYLFKLDLQNLDINRSKLSEIVLKNKCNLNVRITDSSTEILDISKSDIKLSEITNVHVNKLTVYDSLLRITEQTFEQLLKTSDWHSIQNIRIKPLYFNGFRSGLITYRIGEILHKVKLVLNKKRILSRYSNILNNTSEQNTITLVLK